MTTICELYNPLSETRSSLYIFGQAMESLSTLERHHAEMILELRTTLSGCLRTLVMFYCLISQLV